MDHASVQQWLDRYVQAWITYDPQAIRDLFNENALYRYSPYHEPIVGREEIMATWLDDPDKPGTYKAEYHPLVVEGDTAVVNGRSTYFNSNGKKVDREFDNIFLIRFDEQGRCLEFTEWYMQKPK